MNQIDRHVSLDTADAPRVLAGAASRRRLRSIFSGSVGNLVEWYDWYVYAAFAVYFAHAFFPRGDLTAQLLNTAGIFAVGFLVRPLGGWLLGWYADRRGRKAALMLSVLMMCAGSLLIAVTPGYAAIGAAAPALLVFARLLQGLSVGGEYGTSATYLSEVATPERRGFYSSFQYVTLILGQLLALTVLLVLQHVFLSEEQLRAWGWRIPFAIGAGCAVVALLLRRGMAESDAFSSAKGAAGRGSLRMLLAHPREVAIVFGLTMGGTVSFYTFTTYSQKFLINTAGFAADTATAVSAAALVIFMLLQPLVGLISDYTGRRATLLSFGVLATLGTVPLMTALGSASTPLVAFALILLALTVVSGYTAVNAIVKAELFPTEIRALGVGLPYAIAVAAFGGTAEYVALWFKSIGRESGFYWYVTACAAASLLVYAFMPETRRQSRIPAA
ncbi:MAG TPA: MFS transporter [Steroidobacteraceae bacterium]|nr:MFS transporter [Steroidobacteraceae bacterium]